MSTPTSIQTKLSNTLHYNPGGALGGGGGGEGSGSGGGGALGVPGGLGGPNTAQNPILQVTDIRAIEALLQTFSGNRACTDNFIEEVKIYLYLNDNVPGFNSPMKKITFVLTLIKGPDIADWCHDMGAFYDTLDVAIDNIPALWGQFLLEFKNQFQDMQKADHICDKLEGLHMYFLHIDQYISEFEELACQASYVTGNTETIHVFTKGLVNQSWKMS